MVLGSSAVTGVRVALARYVSLSRKPVGATRARTQTDRRAACYLCLTGPQNPPFVWSVTPNLVEPPPSPSPSPTIPPAQTRSAGPLTADADIYRGEKSIATGRRLRFHRPSFIIQTLRPSEGRRQSRRSSDGGPGPCGHM